MKPIAALGTLALVSLLAASCGAAETGVNSKTGDGEAAVAVACSEVGAIRFPTAYLAGPELDEATFVATEPGRVLESFFRGGEGSPENHAFVDAHGFSIVSAELVLGYSEGLPSSFFELEHEAVRGWGGCNPTLVKGDLVAYRWFPAEPLDRAATVIPIEIVGGACVTDAGTEAVTEIDSVDVDEGAERVAVTVWVRDNMESMGIGMCAGVGHSQTTEADLVAPLGDRILLDAGIVPAAPPTP